MVPTVCKFLGTVDAATGKTARVRLAAAARAIGINNTVRHDFLFDGRGQRFRLGIVRGNGIGPPVAFRNAEDNRFSCRAALQRAGFSSLHHYLTADSYRLQERRELAEWYGRRHRQAYEAAAQNTCNKT